VKVCTHGSPTGRPPFRHQSFCSAVALSLEVQNNFRSIWTCCLITSHSGVTGALRSISPLTIFCFIQDNLRGTVSSQDFSIATHRFSQCTIAHTGRTTFPTITLWRRTEVSISPSSISTPCMTEHRASLSASVIEQWQWNQRPEDETKIGSCPRCRSVDRHCLIEQYTRMQSWHQDVHCSGFWSATLVAALSAAQGLETCAFRHLLKSQSSNHWSFVRTRSLESLRDKETMKGNREQFRIGRFFEDWKVDESDEKLRFLSIGFVRGVAKISRYSSAILDDLEGF
jgi:hypothetical protein